jgi:hypothetical protein
MLATFLVVASILAIAVLCWVVIGAAPANTMTVFTTVIALTGTWVGTILTYYFTREGFEAANRSVTQLVSQITPQQKLESTPVKEKMIPRDTMYVKTLPESAINLVAVRNEMTAQNRNRLPVLTTSEAPAYITHRSMIDNYLAQKALQGTSQADLQNLTLANLLTDRPDLRALFESSFATVREAGTLADAKKSMDGTPNCQDVFVTPGGTKDEEVRGWITNVIIEANATV